jgi:hypothetical protein
MKKNNCGERGAVFPWFLPNAHLGDLGLLHSAIRPVQFDVADGSAQVGGRVLKAKQMPMPLSVAYGMPCLVSTLRIGEVDDTADLGHLAEHLDVLIGRTLPIIAQAKVLKGQGICIKPVGTTLALGN